MPYPYFTQVEAAAHVGDDLIVRCLDNQNVGEVEAETIAQYIDSACSRTRARVRVRVTASQIADFEVTTPVELKRLALEAFEISLVKKTPEVFPNKDWEALEKSWRQDVDDWAKGAATLDEPSVAPAVSFVESEELRGF